MSTSQPANHPSAHPATTRVLRPRLGRGALRAAALGVGVSALLMAGPALATPVGWDDPDRVSGLQVLVVFVLAPVALFAATVLLASLPTFAKRAKAAPQVTDAAPESAALTAPDQPGPALAAPAREKTGIDDLLGD